MDATKKLESFIKSPYTGWLKLNVGFQKLKENDEGKYLYFVQRIEERLKKKYEEGLIASAVKCTEVKKMEMRVIELEGRNLDMEVIDPDADISEDSVDFVKVPSPITDVSDESPESEYDLPETDSLAEPTNEEQLADELVDEIRPEPKDEHPRDEQSEENVESVSSGSSSDSELSGPVKKRIKIMKNTKQFQCDKCDKRFGQKIYLKVHKRTHDGDNPFECQFCSETFDKITDYKKHVKLHAQIV